MNDKLFFDYLRKKKADWSNKSRAKLTQSEVDEANKILEAPDAIVVAPVTAPSVSTPSKALGSQKGPLAAIVGSLAASVLFTSIPEDEGTRLKAYKDVAGIVTICQGDTNNVFMGMVETPEGCRQRLEKQLVIHAKGAMACTPRLLEPGHDYQRAAAVSLAYNIGVGAYCKSSIDKYFDQGDFVRACNNFMLYSKARVKGKLQVVRGLQLRRERERLTCLKGLT